MQNSLLNRISFLNQTTVESLAESDEKNIIKRFADYAVNIMGGDFGFVWLRNENENLPEFELVYTSPDIPYQPKLPRPRGSTYKVTETKKPLFIEDLAKSKYVRNDANPFITTIAVIPMVYKNEVYGSFFVCFKECHPFSEEDKSLAEFIGNDAGQVITIHRLHLTQHKKAERDSQKLLRQKDEFFNIASHELKTPVTTIKGFAQMLSEKIENEKGDPTTKYFLNKINLQVDKLSRLVNDLLDISRLETGKLKIEKSRFELNRLVDRAVEDLKVGIKDHHISFKTDLRFWVTGDYEHIERVVVNLVNNAAKYSPTNTKIKICLKQKERNMVAIEVEDFGIGIAEKDKTKIFNRFFQSKNSTAAGPGMGLGLYISRAIVRYHGGNLDFERKTKTKGTIFHFTLPYHRCAKITKK